MNTVRRIAACMALLSPLLVAGCPPMDQDVLGADVPAVRIVASTEIGPIDPFEVTEHRLDGDILSVDVSYSGGCETHEFVGLVGSAVMESNPVQMRGRIAHDDRDDPCDAIVGGTITLDLTPIRQFYVGLYGSGPASIRLTLDPLPVELLYTF